jgi:hypothetical protein
MFIALDCNEHCFKRSLVYRCYTTLHLAMLVDLAASNSSRHDWHVLSDGWHLSEHMTHAAASSTSALLFSIGFHRRTIFMRKSPYLFGVNARQYLEGLPLTAELLLRLSQGPRPATTTDSVLRLRRLVNRQSRNGARRRPTLSQGSQGTHPTVPPASWRA